MRAVLVGDPKNVLVSKGIFVSACLKDRQLLDERSIAVTDHNFTLALTSNFGSGKSLARISTRPEISPINLWMINMALATLMVSTLDTLPGYTAFIG